MRQIIYGLYSEGPSDNRYFSAFLPRYVAFLLHGHQIEAELFDPIKLDKNPGNTFLDEMRRLQCNHGGLSALFVPMDADSRTIENVLDNKWRPWLQENPLGTWIPIIPIKMLESWLLANKEALAKTLILQPRQIDAYLDSTNPEAITEPKQRLNQLVKLGKLKATLGFEEALAKRANISVLETLPSFRFFSGEILKVIQNV
jgi:hypothetical protein